MLKADSRSFIERSYERKSRELFFLDTHQNVFLLKHLEKLAKFKVSWISLKMIPDLRLFILSVRLRGANER